MRVCIAPFYKGEDRADGGIRRVVEAQATYLPRFGWDVTDNPDEADLIACHGATLVERAGVPMVAICHGLMWEDYTFGDWGDDVNRHVIDVLIRAQAITAPSQWVAHAITRGMLASPEVIYHGIDIDEWAHAGDHLSYVLWNKARIDPISDPADMQAVAKLLPDIPFVTTFGEQTGNVLPIGAKTYPEMRSLVQRAGVYLATTRETFGIGTLEALAAGVPIAGWDYGGQREIVIQGETGYLAPFGDIPALAACIRRCLAERERLSANAIADARARWGWEDKIAQYAALFDRVVQAWREERPKVSVVVTAYNLAQYLPDAIDSVIHQTMSDWELVVIDDCSTDNTPLIVQNYIDASIRYLKTPSNLGLSGARNYGWQHAHGKYIIFLDADDQLEQSALDTLSHALDRDSSIHIAYGSLDTIAHDGTHRQRNPWPAGAFNWQGQIAHLNQLPYAGMMRRDVLARSGGYRVRDWRAEDAAFWMRATSFGFRAAKVTEDATLIYRMHDAQKSRQEARAHYDRDGDWTAWLPWRLAGDPESGVAAMQRKVQPDAALVPFGAQGTPPIPRRAWAVRHHAHPVVSIVIPVGSGHASYLIDALDSIQAQTMVEWEAIVVNDTGALLDLTAHPWARLTETEGRRGAGRARNIGLAHARGIFVLFLDADDVLVPRALELLLRGYIESGGKYAYSDWLTLHDERRIDGPADIHLVREYDQRAMFDGLRHAVTALVETEHARSIGGFDEQMDAWEDWDFFCKLTAHGVCGVRVPTPLLIYRMESGTRRKAAKTQEQALYATIYDRYARYIHGEVDMGCGSCGRAVAMGMANTAINEMLARATGGVYEPEPVTPAPPPVEPAVVRMEFIGDQWGEMTWRSRDGQRPYSAGRDPRSRWINVDPRDADHLESLGVFRRVPVAALQAAAGVETAPVVMTEPRTQQPRGRQHTP